MQVEIITNGLGSETIVVDASQVVVRGDNGSPVQIAAEQGPPGVLLLSSVTDPNFKEALNQIGMDITVMCKKLKG